MSDQLIKHFEDLGFAVKAKKNSHWVDFEIVEIAGKDDEGNFVFLSENLIFNSSFENVSIFAFGSVKWDGCSNWAIGENGVMVHSCNKERLLSIGKVLAACWDWTAELLSDVWHVN